MATDYRRQATIMPIIHLIMNEARANHAITWYRFYTSAQPTKLEAPWESVNPDYFGRRDRT